MMKLWLQNSDSVEISWLSDYLDFRALSGIVTSLPEEVGADAYLLQISHDGLSLSSPGSGNTTPTRVDFLSARLQHRVRTTRRHDGLAKAVGLDRYPNGLHVLDATAGMGTDAYLLAAKGCRVTLVEKHPVMAALLADGLRRAARDPAQAEILARMQLQAGDAHQVLAQLPQDALPDVITLDPMFPPRQKSALVKKDMALMQGLLPPNDDVATLLALAREKAGKRVVLKRPGKAEKTPAVKPDFQVPGKACHFQVFLTAL